MNSIVYTHFNSPFDASALDLGLDRLSAWLDAERDTLGRVLAQASPGQAARALVALDQLHLEPDAGIEDIRELLEEASIYLDLILEAVRAIPTHCWLQTAWGIAGPDAFDRHVCWSGARIEDIVATLRYCLDF